MSFREKVKRMDAALLDKLGDGVAMYNNQCYFHAVIERDVERLTGDGQVIVNQIEITLPTSLNPEKGKRVTHGNNVYFLGDEVRRDDSLTIYSATF